MLHTTRFREYIGETTLDSIDTIIKSFSYFSNQEGDFEVFEGTTADYKPLEETNLILLLETCCRTSLPILLLVVSYASVFGRRFPYSRARSPVFK